MRGLCWLIGLHGQHGPGRRARYWMANWGPGGVWYRVNFVISLSVALTIHACCSLC
jgi:hypothetical protein